MKNILLALKFLTILPFKTQTEIKDTDFAKAMLYFPAVGLFIGLFSLLILQLFNFFPYPLTIALVLAFSIFITGALHLDGFADTCDGFYGNRNKEEILAIMRDPHIATMGVIGLFCLLLIKYCALLTMPKEILWKALILMPVFSRWSQVLACYKSKYARDNGKAKLFIGCVNLKNLILSGLFTLVLFMLLTGFKGAILFLSVVTVVLLLINYIKNRISGMTGDTIGAVSEIAEVIVLLAISFQLSAFSY